MRHNMIRDMEATILRDVCRDIKTEPELIPIGNSSIPEGTTADRARLDVSAVGIWSPMERTFLDVRVFHPHSSSYAGKRVDQVYKMQEKEKKQKYNRRIIEVEKATFTPLVFSTSGGMAPECLRYHKRIAELISLKTKEDYAHVMNHLRQRIRFTLLKTALIALRGDRGKTARRNKTNNENFSNLSFNMIPEMPSYEV